jgi:uncharacterized integral membrane protein
MSPVLQFLALTLLLPLLALPGALAHQTTSQTAALAACNAKAAIGPGREAYAKLEQFKAWYERNNGRTWDPKLPELMDQYRKGRKYWEDQLGAADPEYARCVTATSGAEEKKLPAATTLAAFPTVLALLGCVAVGVLSWRVVVYARQRQLRVTLGRLLEDIERVQKTRDALHHLHKEM